MRKDKTDKRMESVKLRLPRTLFRQLKAEAVFFDRSVSQHIAFRIKKQMFGDEDGILIDIVPLILEKHRPSKFNYNPPILKELGLGDVVKRVRRKPSYLKRKPVLEQFIQIDINEKL